MKIAVIAIAALLSAGVSFAADTYVAPLWTLWLINWSPSISQSAESHSPAVVTALATYPSGNDCYAAINTVVAQLKKAYAPDLAPVPGMMICVAGAPVKH